MKTLILTLVPILLIVIGCSIKKENKIPKSNNDTMNLHNPVVKKDLQPEPEKIVKQEVWYDGGKYWLQTYMITNESQIHPRPNVNYMVGLNTPFALYNESISGTFDFIKINKKIEYEKAWQKVKDREEEEKHIDSNLEILNKL